MNRVWTSLLTALFAVGFAGSALAGHHEEDEKASAQCTHAANEPCPHKHEASAEAEKQCTKHAAGGECNCSKDEKSDAGHAAHS